MAAPQKVGKLRAGYVVPPEAIRSGPKPVAAKQAHRAQAEAVVRKVKPTVVNKRVSMSRTPTPPRPAKGPLPKPVGPSPSKRRNE